MENVATSKEDGQREMKRKSRRKRGNRMRMKAWKGRGIKRERVDEER